MICRPTLPFIGLVLLPFIGCSTTSDFAEDLHGDWYAEGSCDLVKISAEETTGKVWHLAAASGPAAVDTSNLGAMSKKELEEARRNLRDTHRKEKSELRDKMREEGKEYDEVSDATDKLEEKQDKAMEKIDEALDAAREKEMDEMMANAKAKVDEASKKAKAAVNKTAKKGAPPAAAKKEAATPEKKELTREEKLNVEIGELKTKIAKLKAEEPRWGHQDFNLKLDAAQKEIKAEGDKKTVQLDGVFVNGEGCKGTATLSGGNLVFAFQKNSALDGSKPAQSLCSDAFTLVSKKPETCSPPVERGKAELKTLTGSLKKTKEALRKLRNTAGSRAIADSYPHACNDLDPKLHAKISGLKGQCAPRHILRLAQAGWLVEDFKGAPSRFYDGNEMSHLLGPKKENGEKTKLSSEELKKNASRTKRKVFLDKSGPKRCKAEYESGSLKVNCEMPMRDIYTSGSAGFNREQKCENKSYKPDHCAKRCDSHSDCNRFLCGCEASRCNIYGQCTPCPTEYSKDCEDPKFTVTGVNDWKLTKKISSKQKASAQELAKNVYKAEPYFLFKMENAYRKIYQHEKYGEMKVEKDSGYIIKAKPLLFAYETSNGPLILHTEAFTAYHRADGKKYKVSCNEKGLCEIEKK